MPMSTRHGFIFLYVLGLLSITLSLAFALLSAAQTARTGATKIEMDFLASRATQVGAQHAIAVIRQDFMRHPGLPTQLNGAWRTHFWPIDSHKVDDFSLGKEFTPEDLNQNDVPVENGLIEPYFEVDIRRGTYLSRTAAHRDGWYNHPGIARWYEPGRQTSDPVSQPVSFHLSHPVAANGGSADPAVRAGEPYTPDLMNAPVWYDAELVATTDPARVRYRLRYAVAVEDLGGHLLCTVPGAFDATAVPVTSGSPTEAERSKINEVDNAVADRYAGAMSNLFRYTSLYGAAWGDLGLRGLGQSSQYYDTGLGTSQTLLLAGRNGSNQATHFRVGANERVDTLEPSSNGTHYYFNVGPIPSFQALWHKGNNVNTMRRHLLFTPFGRAPQRVTATAPQAWFESRVSTPWRINLPTLAPQALSAMVYSYMPEEFRTMGSDEKIIYDWSGGWWEHISLADRDFGTTGHPPAKFSTIKSAVDLFADMAGEGYFSENGGVAPGEPYPGTNTSAPGSHWRPNLGALVETNTRLGRASMTNLFSPTNYPSIGFSTTTVLEIPTTRRDDLATTVRRYNNHGVLESRPFASEWSANEYDADAGYFHFQSYWLDLAAAMMHAVAVARYAWQDRVNGAVNGVADSGKPRWPASLSASYFPPALAPGFTPGGLTRDRDVTGNGVADVPSAFDSIAEVDAQFLRNLGEWPGNYALGSRPVTANTALRMRHNPDGHFSRLQAVVPVDLSASAPAGSSTIKQLRTAGTITLEQAALMELIVNDMRMSFFGASPDYPDFRPIDLDDDGTVASSAYASGREPAEPATGRGPVPEKWFSLTGCFVIEKSRYYRIITRGQLFDEVRGVPVAEANMETVYVVDPDGDMGNNNDQPAPVLGNGLADSHILFQRRLNNRYLGAASHVNR